MRDAHSDGMWREREIIQKHEPQLYNAINHIFGDSYEYMRKYKEFAKMMDEKTKGGLE